MRFLELFRHMVGLLGRVISPSQGLYLHRITQHRRLGTYIHALSGIRTHDPSNQPAKTHALDRTATVTGYSNLVPRLMSGVLSRFPIHHHGIMRKYKKTLFTFTVTELNFITVQRSATNFSTPRIKHIHSSRHSTYVWSGIDAFYGLLFVHSCFWLPHAIGAFFWVSLSTPFVSSQSASVKSLLDIKHINVFWTLREKRRETSVNYSFNRYAYIMPAAFRKLVTCGSTLQ
jgi:hypothetical protein